MVYCKHACNICCLCKIPISEINAQEYETNKLLENFTFILEQYFILKCCQQKVILILNLKWYNMYICEVGNLEYSSIWISRFSQWSENIAYAATTIFCRKKSFPLHILFLILFFVNSFNTWIMVPPILPKNCKKQKNESMWAKNLVTFYMLGLKFT